MSKKHKVSLGMADHTSNPKSTRRKTIFKAQNELLDNEYNSTKLLIPTDISKPFKEMYHRYPGNNPNPIENIQRVEITSMDEHFNKLKYSDVTFDSTFYNKISKVAGQKIFCCPGLFNMEFKSSI